MEVMENQRLTFASKTENLVKVESMVDDICKEFKVNEDFYGNILVAVTEAVNNAIQHGNKYDPAKNIDVNFLPEEKTIKVCVKDQGEGFDFDNLPDPTDPENIEKPHGRGIFLMRHLADEVEFTDNGKTVELSFNISAN